ncbi:hypothetical protein NQD34_000758 [Periophthalmus magnuspinnatus]|nr:hypothetical protein NQD34_000758 [Periophthalmus magnuspinnatus]
MSEQVPGNMRHLRAALALLLGLHTALGLALVPAPEDVTVHCSDNRPRVSWNYRSHTSANFTVQLVVNEGSFQSQTRHHEFDLSDFIWSNKMQMFDFMYVKITATQGPNRSEPTRSCSFSYNMFKTVDITCRLKFPPVNLTSDGSKATLTFDNPLHFYKELKAIQPAVFELDIIMKNSTQHRQCFFSEKHCIFSLDFPENSNSCVNLTGHVRKGLEQIEVLHLEPVCPTTPPVDVVTEWVVAILSLVIIFIVIVAVTMAICKVASLDFSKGTNSKDTDDTSTKSNSRHFSI